MQNALKHKGAVIIYGVLLQSQILLAAMGSDQTLYRWLWTMTSLHFLHAKIMPSNSFQECPGLPDLIIEGTRTDSVLLQSQILLAAMGSEHTFYRWLWTMTSLQQLTTS